MGGRIQSCNCDWGGSSEPAEGHLDTTAYMVLFSRPCPSLLIASSSSMNHLPLELLHILSHSKHAFRLHEDMRATNDCEMAGKWWWIVFKFRTQFFTRGYFTKSLKLKSDWMESIREQQCSSVAGDLSIPWRSRLWRNHSFLWKSFDLHHSVLALAVCLGVEIPRLPLYLSPSIFLSCLPVAAEEKQSHSMTLPPPYSAVWMVCSSWLAVLVQS